MLHNRISIALLLGVGVFLQAFAALLPAADAVGPADHDWAQWRGPNRDGVAADTGLIKKWPEQGPPLLYCFNGLGDGYCPPSIVGDRAYISGKFGEEAALMAFELPKPLPQPAKDGDMPMLGKMLWKTKYGKSCGSGENAAPVVVGNRIYITSGSGDVAGFDTDGKMLWHHSMQKDFNAHVQTNGSYGFSESPLVDGNKVIVCPGTADAVMVAYDKESGELIWKTANPLSEHKGDAASHCSTMLSNGGGVKQYVNVTGWGLIGVTPEGKFLWGIRKTCESTIPTPIIRGDYVFAISSYGFGSILVKLSGDGAGGVKADTVYKLGSDVCECLCGQAVLLGDYIYVGHGKYGGSPLCIDFLTGKVQWRAKQAGSGVAQLISYDGMLIFRNESKQVLLVEATPKGHNMVSQFIPVSHRVGYAPPVVAHGLLYLRDRDLVMVYDLRPH